eukprot:scaffold258693_cov22-Tisochrysis_lutea.AAC.2
MQHIGIKGELPHNHGTIATVKQSQEHGELLQRRGAQRSDTHVYACSSPVREPALMAMTSACFHSVHRTNADTYCVPAPKKPQSGKCCVPVRPTILYVQAPNLHGHAQPAAISAAHKPQAAKRRMPVCPTFLHAQAPNLHRHAQPAASSAVQAPPCPPAEGITWPPALAGSGLTITPAADAAGLWGGQ